LPALAQNALMRRFLPLAVLLSLAVAACAESPGSLGITGPGNNSAAGTSPNTDPVDNPNALQSGGRYGPSYGPTTGAGHFWGYN